MDGWLQFSPIRLRNNYLVADLRKGLNAHPESQGINVVYQELNIGLRKNWLLDMQEVEFLSGLKMGGLV